MKRKKEFMNQKFKGLFYKMKITVTLLKNMKIYQIVKKEKKNFQLKNYKKKIELLMIKIFILLIDLKIVKMNF